MTLFYVRPKLRVPSATWSGHVCWVNIFSAWLLVYYGSNSCPVALEYPVTCHRSYVPLLYVRSHDLPKHEQEARANGTITWPTRVRADCSDARREYIIWLHDSSDQPINLQPTKVCNLLHTVQLYLFHPNEVLPTTLPYTHFEHLEVQWIAHSLKSSRSKFVSSKLMHGAMEWTDFLGTCLPDVYIVF